MSATRILWGQVLFVGLIAFTAGVATMAAVGGVFLSFAWINHEPPTTEPWQSDLWRMVVFACVGGGFLHYNYLRTIQRLDRHIGWLEQTLRGVNNRLTNTHESPVQQHLQSRLNYMGDK